MDLVGKFIGKQGAGVKKLKKQYQCDINIPKGEFGDIDHAPHPTTRLKIRNPSLCLSVTLVKTWSPNLIAKLDRRKCDRSAIDDESTKMHQSNFSPVVPWLFKILVSAEDDLLRIPNGLAISKELELTLFEGRSN